MVSNFLSFGIIDCDTYVQSPGIYVLLVQTSMTFLKSWLKSLCIYILNLKQKKVTLTDFYSLCFNDKIVKHAPAHSIVSKPPRGK